MQTVTELTLPSLRMEEPSFAVDPFAQFAAARREHPWLAKSTFGYVVTEYAATRDFLMMDGQMRTAHEGVVQLMNAHGTAWGRFQLEQILAQRGDAHKRVRNVVAPMFTPRAANEHRDVMRRVISVLLDEWGPKRAFDFEEFASYFPITVMCSLIGAPASEIPRLRSSLEALGLSFSLLADHLPALEKAMEVLEAFVVDLVAKRRAGERLGDRPDLLDQLIKANDTGELSDAEMTNLLVFLFVAGYDTSKNVLTLIMRQLLERPDMYARCAADFAYCKKVIEEGLRFSNPATVPRITDMDLVYRDVLFPKDTMLFMPVSVIGRDPSATPEPDEFRPDRAQDNRHMAFGRGMHMCLGQFIARAQLEEGLHLVAGHLVKPRLAGSIGFRPFPGVWGLRGLPIETDFVPVQSPA